MEALKWLRSEGCPWDAEACIHAAALHGHLDVLKYLHENGCPWDWRTCAWAAEEGHLDVLKYLHENGCPWEEEVYPYFSKSVREWLKEKGLRFRGEYDDDSDEYSDEYSDDERNYR